MTNQWVDFRELRSKLRFSDVLKSYNVELKVKGDRATGFCPLPSHNGKRRSPSFSANLARGVFQCFGCGAKGNVLDFACYMESSDPADSTALRKVALLLQDRFGLAPECAAQTGAKPVEKAADSKAIVPPTQAEPEKKRIINAPIDFELKKLDVGHPYLGGRGFTPETVTHFGLGFCSRGLMADRIAIPLPDPAGKLIGYAGRVVDDANISQDNPKYRFPGERERDGVIYEFRKSLFLYNGHRITAPVTDLVIVEGFPSVWWLHQQRYANVVALMGSSCSPEQATLITGLVGPNGRVWVLADGDDAGERCAKSVLAEVAPHHFVRWVKLPVNKQPTDCSVEALKALLW